MKTQITRTDRFFIALIILCILVGIFGNICRAQDRKTLTRNGNNFMETKARTARDSTATPYTYTDSRGETTPIFLSKSGKAFIPKISKNGKYYRRYLPEVTKQIANKEN